MTRSRSSSTSRRAFLRGAGATLAGAGFAPCLGLAQSSLATTEIADKLILVTGAGGNILVHATDAGQVVVDGGARAARDSVLATLDRLPGGGAVALFNTHWHPDQVGANEALGMGGATIYAHEKTRQRLTAGYYRPDQDLFEPPLPPAGRPTETIYTEATVTVGGSPVEYGYLIEAHTDGDIFVRFPGLDVIAVGDAISPERDPVFDWFGGGWLGGRLDSIRRLLEISDDDTRFVPSYGPVIGRRELLAENDVYLALFELMVEHLRLGETADDIHELGVIEGVGREFDDPGRLLYDLAKGFWAHHNKLMHDIV